MMMMMTTMNFFIFFLTCSFPYKTHQKLMLICEDASTSTGKQDTHLMQLNESFHRMDSLMKLFHVVILKKSAIFFFKEFKNKIMGAGGIQKLCKIFLYDILYKIRYYKTKRKIRV
ncbi:hypothetical protein GDO78_013076 [Eleutherodactylus coqui]|uniref:Secreted protein n=1 Tax=Eleutherodactylus coqui TaxID=57060 RepID=A0A8J6EYR1_ELECQ|nr:hypothetical protein GDO78_013076 [Eleutherodactylus coqui]